MGQDRSVFRIKGENAIRNSVQWGNNLVAFRWNHLFNERLFSNTTIAYTRYRFLTKSESILTNNNENIDSRNQFLSGIYDVSAKFELEYFISNDYKFRFGINSIHHEYRPGITRHRIKENGNTVSNTQIGNTNINAWEHAFYLENEFKIGDYLSSNMGIRAVRFKVQNSAYTSFEPRGLVNLKINPYNTFKAAYTQIQQNIHLLTTSGVGLPIDLWVPPTANIPPQRVKQWSLGWAKQSKSNRYEYSLEAYTKKFQNLISYKEGASFIGNTNDWESLVEGNGKGWAQGLEFLIEKKRGRTTGWLGYTLSKTERQFSNINQEKKFPFRYDKRHDISWFITHQLNDRVYFSATWVYSTGLRYSLPIAKYDLIDERIDFNENKFTEVYIYGDRNDQKLTDYHRLDLGINFSKDKKWGKRTWNISIYNAYNRQNAYFNYVDSEITYTDFQDTIGNEVTTIKQQSLFPIIPSVSYAFEF